MAQLALGLKGNMASKECIKRRGSQDKYASQYSDPIAYLRESIDQGTPWHLALLKAAGMWTLSSEEYQGRHYCYLVGGEAFDWLVLAERLITELNGKVPVEEQEDLLFRSELPEEVEDARLEQLLGLTKYQAYMSFWYGVVVEEALQLAIEEEARKEQRARGHADGDDVEEAVFLRLYNDTCENLRLRFLQERGHPYSDSQNLTEFKELTYWLFKTRISIWDPARVASDTRKGLDKLQMVRVAGLGTVPLSQRQRSQNP